MMRMINLSFVLLQMMRNEKTLQTATELGPSLESLADATFELLKMQDWFDSILVIDDSSASDILSFRLTFLYERHRKAKKKEEGNRTTAFDDARSNPDAHSVGSSRNRLQVIKISKSLPEKEVRTSNVTKSDTVIYA